MKNHKVKSQQTRTFIEESILLIFLIIGAILIFQTNILKIYTEQQFVELAQSFTQGKLYFLPSHTVIDDTSEYNGKLYWPLGPLPAVILMPFVAIWGLGVQQGYIQFFAILLIFFLLLKIAQKITGDLKLSLWLSFGYIFASAFIGIATFPWSWQFGQVISSTFILYSLYEYLHKRRWWAIGISIALATTARINLLLTALFFVLQLLLTKDTKKEKIKNLVIFSLPIIISLILLLIYNFLRFDNFFEQGYSFQNLHNPLLAANREHGLWSLVHMPANIYYFLLKGPDGVFVPNTQILQSPYIQANRWGLSILFTSPLFLWLTKASWKNKDVILASITSCLLAFAIFGFYGIGFSQFGFRYALEFYPFLFLILALAVKETQTRLLKSVIILSCCFNLYLLLF